MKYPRVLLADDQIEMIEVVVQLLRERFDILGILENGERLLEAEARLHSDLIVLDISMPVMNGIEAAIRLARSGSKAKIIFLTVHEDRDFVDAALSTGALGYVLKPRVATDLIPAIEYAFEGNVFVSSTLETEKVASVTRS